MRTVNKLLIIFISVVLTSGIAFAQTPDESKKTITFRFIPGNDGFYIPWRSNDVELNRLYSLVDKYLNDITSGRMPVHVDGYCVPTAEDTHAALKLAAIRSNRVKSELITHKGLLEKHFITHNYAVTYTAGNGQVYRNIVVVTLQIPVREETESAPVREETKQQPLVTSPAQPETVAEREPAPAQTTAKPKPNTSYLLALRTNTLYDAFLLPTLGIEWLVNQHVSIKLDGSRSWWGSTNDKVQKIWLISPEVRWYLLKQKHFYVGASANFGEYNIYKYMASSIVSDDTGYQGKMWGAGLTVGYQLYLSRSFSLDFNLGLGYTRFEYDTFVMQNERREYKDHDRTKNFWGPTQAGINLVWKIW